MKLQLNSPSSSSKASPKRAEALQRLASARMGDLLYHTPHRYLDATTVTPLARATVGHGCDCVGRVVSTGVLPTRRGLRCFRAVLKDESGLLECAWPGRPFLERQIKKGQLFARDGAGAVLPRQAAGARVEFIVLAEPDDDGGGDPGLVLPSIPPPKGSRTARSAHWSSASRRASPTRQRSASCRISRRVTSSSSCGARWS